MAIEKKVSRSFSWRRHLLEAGNKLLFCGRRRSRLHKGNVRVLVVAQNRLMFEYVSLLWKVFSECVPVRFAYFSGLDSLQADAQRIGLSPLSVWNAKSRRFDFILLAEHAPSTFDPYASRLIVPHGPVRSRPIREWSYYYEQNRIFWIDGRPVYDLMFDNSQAAQQEAIQRIPEYLDRIHATGDLRTSQLFENAKRATMTSPPRVALMSTWGPYGLLESHGEWLLKSLKSLVERNRIRLSISMHPNIWAGRLVSRDWVNYVNNLSGIDGIDLIRPEDNWTIALADCSLTITDHTSLAASFAATGRPILPVDVDVSQVGEGTFFDALTKIVTPLKPSCDLERRIFDLHEKGMPSACEQVLKPHIPIVHDVQKKMSAAILNLVNRKLG